MEMRKATLIALCAVAALVLGSAVATYSSRSNSPRALPSGASSSRAVSLTASSSSETQSSYAEDRAEIEDLQGRYMFALDFKDADTYASTFTEDGVLDYGPVAKGRDAIKKVVAAMGKRAADQSAKNAAPGMGPVVGRHNITNIVIKIDGDKAEGRAYWFHYSNNNPQRKAQIDSFGNYEDEMVKVDGKWLFSKRKIYNEQVADWAYKGGNPAW
jgi:ketosteroid isomerase-like protein